MLSRNASGKLYDEGFSSKKQRLNFVRFCPAIPEKIEPMTGLIRFDDVIRVYPDYEIELCHEGINQEVLRLRHSTSMVNE